MSIQLIESIVSNNMLEANDMVEAKLAEIRERKMYEMKRMFAAKMYEAAGGMTKAEMEAKRKAGYRKASDVLGDRIKTQLSAATKKYREGKAAETEAPSNAPKITPPEAKKKMKAAYSKPKGSKVGKAARFVAGGVAGGVGRAVRSIVSNLGDIGTSRL